MSVDSMREGLMPNRPTPTDITRLLKQRSALDRNIGEALTARIVGLEVPQDRDPVPISHTSAVAVRIVKRGVVYSFALNLNPLPFQESGLYPLHLLPGRLNGLVWTIFKSKTPWAYQIDLIVDDQVLLLEHQSSGDNGALPRTGQRIINVR